MKIKTTWKDQIERTLISVSESFTKEKEGNSQNQAPSSSAQADQNDPIEIDGLVLPSDLPQGSQLDISDELVRYRQLPQNEFLSCKSRCYRAEYLTMKLIF